jgi:hypothetical protein
MEQEGRGYEAVGKRLEKEIEEESAKHVKARGLG